jgi:small GTP-binding protein
MSQAGAYKVMLLGEIGVGKSSLAQRLVFDRYEASYKPTIGVDVYRYEVAGPNGVPVPLILWDSDGNLGEAIFRHVYLKEAAAAIIVGDHSRPETIPTMLDIAAGFRQRRPGRCVTFIVNKLDLAGSDGLELPAGLNTEQRVFQTSALTGENVHLAFKETVSALLRLSA